MISRFLNILVEKLNPKERSQLLAATGLENASRKSFQDGSKRQEIGAGAYVSPFAKAFRAVFNPGENAGREILFLLMRSNQRIVVDRLRNYLQKYLPAAQEITDAMVAEHGGIPGTPKYAKLKNELIVAPRFPAPQSHSRRGRTDPAADERSSPPAIDVGTINGPLIRVRTRRIFFD